MNSTQDPNLRAAHEKLEAVEKERDGLKAIVEKARIWACARLVSDESKYHTMANPAGMKRLLLDDEEEKARAVIAAFDIWSGDAD